MNTLRFIRTFFLIPCLVCLPLSVVAVTTGAWIEALAVGVLTGIAITGWALSSILAWKHAFDARQELSEAERELHELYAERDAQAVYEEHNL